MISQKTSRNYLVGACLYVWFISVSFNSTPLLTKGWSLSQLWLVDFFVFDLFNHSITFSNRIYFYSYYKNLPTWLSKIPLIRHQTHYVVFVLSNVNERQMVHPVVGLLFHKLAWHCWSLDWLKIGRCQKTGIFLDCSNHVPTIGPTYMYINRTQTMRRWSDWSRKIHCTCISQETFMVRPNL